MHRSAGRSARAGDLAQLGEVLRSIMCAHGLPVSRRSVVAKGSTRKRAQRSTSRNWHGHVLRHPRVIGSLMVLLLLFITAIGAHTLVDGLRTAVPTTAPFRYTIVAGDTVASVSSLFAADTTSIVSQTDGTLVPGTYLTVDAARLWGRMTSAPFGGNEILVEQGAKSMDIHPSLALAVAWQESRLQQDVRSPAGAVGIMQVEPDTSKLAAHDLGRPIDPSAAIDNVTAGLFWLHALLTSYHQDEASTLAAYYEGPGNLQRRGYLSGTAEYVAHVRQIESALLTANPNLNT